MYASFEVSHALSHHLQCSRQSPHSLVDVTKHTELYSEPWPTISRHSTRAENNEILQGHFALLSSVWLQNNTFKGGRFAKLKID